MFRDVDPNYLSDECKGGISHDREGSRRQLYSVFFLYLARDPKKQTVRKPQGLLLVSRLLTPIATNCRDFPRSSPLMQGFSYPLQ